MLHLTLTRHSFALPFALLSIAALCPRLHAQEPRLEAVYAPQGCCPEPHRDTNKVRYSTFTGLLIEENVLSEMYPLLTYVFFDAGSGTIPDRYVRFTDPHKTERFTDTTIPGGTLQKYCQVLNIVGYRMRINPAARIEIVGNCSEQPDSGETKEVSAQRGRAVYDYLVNIWRIDTVRITLLPPRGYPEARSNPRDLLGSVENRRVEIRSKDWDIMKPVVHRDVVRYPHPEFVAFRMENGIHPGLVAYRTIEISRDGQLWHVVKDIGIIDSISMPFEWGRSGDIDSLPDDEAPYVAQLVVYEKDGTPHRSNEVRIPVEIVTLEEKIRERLIDSVVERCYLLFAGPAFKIQNYSLNERLLSEFVCSRLRPGVGIEIVGHTDVIGLDDINGKLAEQRARTVEHFIRRCPEKDRITSISSRGVGESEQLYSNELPEGRFYNRTVVVTMTAPTGK